jgi:hypothetical protein
MLKFQSNVFQEFISSPQIRYTALPLKLRLKFEDFFQADFSKIRIHEGFIAQKIGALALTSGSKIIFAPSSYCPDLKNGQRLIAHELTHVIQQREGRIHINHSAGPYLLDDFELENEAERCADAFISGQKHANIKRDHTPYQSCAMVVQPAKVRLRNKIFVPGDKNLNPNTLAAMQTYWNDFQTIQQILTTPELFLPALRYLESQIFGEGDEPKALSKVLLGKEREQQINLQGAPLYVGAIKDWDFKKTDDRAKGKGLLAKDYVSPDHGDFTHRIHWFIIMYYCNGGPGYGRLALKSSPFLLLTKMGYYSQFKIETADWPNWTINGEDSGFSPEARSEVVWVALFDRMCSDSNYNIHEDWLTQPEIFTSLFLPEQFRLEHPKFQNFNSTEYISRFKSERTKPGQQGQYYNFSSQFPKLSKNITKRFIKREIELRMAGNKLDQAEKVYLERKTAKNFPLSTSSKQVLFRPNDPGLLQDPELVQVVDLEVVATFDIMWLQENERTLIDLYRPLVNSQLVEAITTATNKYREWYHNEKSFGFWKHGDRGQEKAARVSALAQVAPDPFLVLHLFFINRITKIDANPTVFIGGSINDNKHSYSAFLFNEIKNYPLVIANVKRKNALAVDFIESQFKGRDFTADAQGTSALRARLADQLRLIH